MTDLETAVEQLWYTWSDVGLSTVQAGFRIRAVSPGLTEIYSNRVKSMDRLMLYTLPPGTDRFAITPDMAPVCLAYLRTDQNEYVLVHKAYVGPDGVGRLGNFFIHLLAPGDAADIDTTASLWSANFWKISDASLKDRRSTSLDPMLSKTLDKEADKFIGDYTTVSTFLPFLIEAYLSRKDARSPLYIAAPASSTYMIASLIHGLIISLPLSLLKNLTFSTYEPDVTKATTLIAGTSWIEIPGKPSSSQVFSPQFYQEHLAVNCATGDKSSLDNHRLTINNPLARNFAAYATNCLLSGNLEDLFNLRDQAEPDISNQPDLAAPDLSMVNAFLSLFKDVVVNTDPLSPSEIEAYLKNPNYCLNKLSNQGFRQNIITHLINDPTWWSLRLKSLILNLRNSYKQETTALSTNYKKTSLLSQGSEARQTGTKKKRRTATQRIKKITLLEALTLLAQDAIEAVYAAITNPPLSQNREVITTFIQVLDSCVLPGKSYDLWKLLLNRISTNVHTHRSLTSNWLVLVEFLRHSDHILSEQPLDVQILRPFLIVSWSHLGDFLTLKLSERHWEWVVIVIDNLAKDTSLTSHDAELLKRQYHQAINTLLQRLCREQRLCQITAIFTTHLTRNGYRGDSTYSRLQLKLLTDLIVATDTQPQFWLTARDMIVVLAMAGLLDQSYFPLISQLVSAFLSHKQEDAGIDLCRALVSQSYRDKTNLVSLLLTSSKRYRRLKDALHLLYPDLQERADFFVQYGASYLSIPENVQEMQKIYVELLPIPGKVDRLFILLDANLSEDEKLPILKAAGLESSEDYVRLLRHYGVLWVCDDLRLADYTIGVCRMLAQSNYKDIKTLCLDLFKYASSYKHREDLLALVDLSTLEEYLNFFRAYAWEKAYIPFFRQSPIVLQWLDFLALYMKRQGYDFFSEKMEIVLAWLSPPTTNEQNVGLQAFDEIKNVVKAAALTRSEEMYFLEQLGAVYLPYYKSLAFLKQYVKDYALAFTLNDLSRQDALRFLSYLNKYRVSLSLDQHTTQQIVSWDVINNYFTHPDSYINKFADIADAIFTLNLQSDPNVAVKLAQVASAPSQLKDIFSYLSAHLNNIEQILYYIAEESVKTRSRGVINLDLAMYLVFILDFAQERPIRSEHLVMVFLDALLQNIDVNETSGWKELDSYVSNQQLSEQALAQWHLYLQHLRLSDIISSQKGSHALVAIPQAQHTSWLKKLILSALELIGHATIAAPTEEDATYKVSQPPVKSLTQRNTPSASLSKPPSTTNQMSPPQAQKKKTWWER